MPCDAIIAHHVKRAVLFYEASTFWNKVTTDSTKMGFKRKIWAA
jgi:hypothetical protein